MSRYAFSNQLSGEIPDSLAELPKLKSLYVACLRPRLCADVRMAARSGKTSCRAAFHENSVKTSCMICMCFMCDCFPNMPGAETRSLSDLSGNHLSGTVPSALNQLQSGTCFLVSLSTGRDHIQLSKNENQFSCYESGLQSNSPCIRQLNLSRCDGGQPTFQEQLSGANPAVIQASVAGVAVVATCVAAVIAFVVMRRRRARTLSTLAKPTAHMCTCIVQCVRPARSRRRTQYTFPSIRSRRARVLHPAMTSTCHRRRAWSGLMHLCRSRCCRAPPCNEARAHPYTNRAVNDMMLDCVLLVVGIHSENSG